MIGEDAEGIKAKLGAPGHVGPGGLGRGQEAGRRSPALAKCWGRSLDGRGHEARRARPLKQTFLYSFLLVAFLDALAQLGIDPIGLIHR